MTQREIASDAHALTREQMLEIAYYLHLTPYSPPLEAAALPEKAKVLTAARELLAY